MRLLILINPQIDFCEGGAVEISGAVELLNIAAKEASNFDKVICLKEWHPADHISFAANHPWRYPGQKINFHGQELKLTITHCVQDQFGAFVHPSCKSINFESVIELGSSKLLESDQEFATIFESTLVPILESENLHLVKLMGLVHNDIDLKLTERIQDKYPNLKMEDAEILRYLHPEKK